MERIEVSILLEYAELTFLHLALARTTYSCYEHHFKAHEDTSLVEIKILYDDLQASPAWEDELTNENITVLLYDEF